MVKIINSTKRRRVVHSPSGLGAADRRLLNYRMKSSISTCINDLGTILESPNTILADHVRKCLWNISEGIGAPSCDGPDSEDEYMDGLKDLL